MRNISAKFSLHQVTNMTCPICLMDEEHDDLNSALFYRSKSEKFLMQTLADKGYHFTLEELRTHRRHLRAVTNATDKWLSEKELLNLDEKRLAQLPSLESTKIIESKISSVRTALNQLEELGAKTTPEYNVMLRRLIDLIELKEKIEGKITDNKITISLSDLKEKLEEKRKG